MCKVYIIFSLAYPIPMWFIGTRQAYFLRRQGCNYFLPLFGPYEGRQKRHVKKFI